MLATSASVESISRLSYKLTAACKIMTELTNGVNNHDGKNVQCILQPLNQINTDSFANDGDRIQAVVAAYALVSRLETPWEFV
jgi:hypothetical protein